MKYAKCIREEQLCKTKDEFLSRQDEDNYVYLIGETTKHREDLHSLDCVPLNCVYGALKHGLIVAILDFNDDKPYEECDDIEKATIHCKEQTVVEVMPAFDKKTLDCILDEVKDPSLMMDNSYVSWWGEPDFIDYYNKRISSK